MKRARRAAAGADDRPPRRWPGVAFIPNRFNAGRAAAWRAIDAARVSEGAFAYWFNYGLWWAGVATVPLMWAIASFWR